MLDPDAKVAALDERVLNLGRQFASLEHQTREGFSAINIQLTSISREMSAGQKTPWGVLASVASVALVGLGMIGGLVYVPMQNSIQDNKVSTAELRKDVSTSLADLVKSTVSQAELKWRSDRALEDRQNTKDALGALSDQQVPRKEYDERWRGADQRFVDVQRQLDALATAFGASYSLRDALLDMKAKIDRLEAEKHP